VHEIADSFTQAIEAGVVAEATWLRQIFGTKRRFDDFLAEFECYDDSWRVPDRWHVALSVLGKSVLQDENLVRCSDIAARLRTVASESGQL